MEFPLQLSLHSSQLVCGTCPHQLDLPLVGLRRLHARLLLRRLVSEVRPARTGFQGNNAQNWKQSLSLLLPAHGRMVHSDRRRLLSTPRLDSELLLARRSCSLGHSSGLDHRRRHWTQDCWKEGSLERGCRYFPENG